MAPGMFGGDLNKAIANFQRSLELDKKSDETWFWLARAYRKLNNHESFEKTMRTVLRLNPKNVLAQKELAEDSGHQK